MPATDPKIIKGQEALGVEKDLLIALQNATTTFMSNAGNTKGNDVAVYICEDWKRSFGDLAGINDELIREDEDEFKQDIKDEISALKNYILLTEEHGLGRSWKKFFKSDLKIARQLLGQEIVE